MKNKNKNKIKFFILAVFILSAFFLQCFQVAVQYRYTPMEDIPGFPWREAPTDPAGQFKYLIEGLYKFGIWTVGVAALLMIIIGGFMYMASAGNTAKAGTAKSIIWDAIYGLVVALLAWLLLNTINPDLTNLNLSMTAIPPRNGNSSPASPDSSTPSASTRPTQPTTPVTPTNCSPLTSGPASVTNLQNTCFGNNAQKMSQIARVESGGDPLKESSTDRCKDGSSWSIGLFQINMIAHASKMGYNSKSVFEVNGSGPQGSCLQRVTNSSGVSYCAVRDCRVIDQAAYNNMKAKLTDPAYNIQLACQISNNGNNIRPAWTTTANRCQL